MATTKIWSIKHSGSLIKVVDYTTNEAKTIFIQPENPNDFVRSAMSDSRQTDSLNNVLDYTLNDEKTHEEKFVTSLNCTEQKATQEMEDTKLSWNNTGGIIAFHGIQAFKPDETTAELAHKIGVELAKKLWGGRFEVVVSTHLDKNHLHNHFVLNSVSFADGLKFYDNKETYRRMRIESDKLCEQYNLSVVEQGKPENGWRVGRKTGKHYAERKAEKEGKPTLRGIVKSDLDTAIQIAKTENEVWRYLKDLGYSLKFGQDVTAKPPGFERGIKIYRNFGEGYSIANIRRRVVNERPNLNEKNLREKTAPPLARQTLKQNTAVEQPPMQKHSGFLMQRQRYFRGRFRLRGTFPPRRRIGGFRALYFSYLHLLGGVKVQYNQSIRKPQTPKDFKRLRAQTWRKHRTEILQLEKYKAQITFLFREKIDTAEQLAKYKSNCKSQILTLTEQRHELRKAVRRLERQVKLEQNIDFSEIQSTKQQITEITAQLKSWRKDLRLCSEVEENSRQIKVRLSYELEPKNTNEKEVMKERAAL